MKTTHNIKNWTSGPQEVYKVKTICPPIYNTNSN